MGRNSLSSITVPSGRHSTILATGTHEELMERGGLYADMFSAQKQWYVNGGKEAELHAG